MHYFILIICAFATSLIPLFFNPYFYFIDDFESYYLPIFLEIGRILSSGEFPILLSKSWFSGSLLIEHTSGIFNPFSLLIYFILYQMQLPFEQAGAVFSIFHLIVSSLGFFVLCRKLKFSWGICYFVSLSLLHGGFLMYWAASTWVVMLSAFAWLPWAVLGLYGIRNKKYAAIGILASYLLLTAGSPQVDIILLIFVFGAALYFYWESEYKNSVYVILVFVIACFLAAPSILPLVEGLPYTTRGWRNPYSWKSNLEHLLAIGLPSFRGIYKVWDGSSAHSSAPFSYISWLTPIVILGYLINPYKKVNSLIKSSIAISISLGILCMLPSPYLVNISIRYLLGFHLSVLLLTASILSIQGTWRHLFTWKTIHYYSLFVFLLPPLSYIGNREDRNFIFLYLISSVLFVALLYFLKLVYFPEKSSFSGKLEKIFSNHLIQFFRSLRDKNALLWVGCLTISTFIFIGIVSSSRKNKDVADFSMSKETIQANPFGFGQEDHVFYLVRPNDYWGSVYKKPFIEKVMVGNSVLYQEHYRALNGYSPIQWKALAAKFPVNYLGHLHDPETCVKNLFTIVKPYDRPLIELMGINRIVSFLPLKYLVDQYKTKGWELTEEGDGVALYTDSKKSSGNHIFSHVPRGVTVENIKAREAKIQFSYETTEEYDGSPIVISRFGGLPGYFFKENDEAPKPTPTISELVLSVPLQKKPHTKNQVEIYYFPKGLKYGLYTAGLGVLFSFFFLFSFNNFRKNRKNS